MIGSVGLRVAGLAAGLGVTFGIAALSRGSYRPFPDSPALLRLAWSARPERIETCRRQTEEELAKWPPHMRQLVVCEGTSARYRLEVLGDGVVLLSDTVQGSGARHDRPLYVLRERLLDPGTLRIEVRFSRLDHPTPEGALDGGEAVGAAQARAAQEQREAAERERRREEAIPPVLALDTLVQLGPREVLLVTYDRTLRALVARAGPGR